MGKIENLEIGNRLLYSEGYFSGNYNQNLYIKRSSDDGSNRPKYFLSAFTTIDGELRQQGYLYFYLDHDTKSSFFIGIKVEEEYRNLNIGSFLVASWINLCLNNGYEFLGVHEKQRKPFLLYLLKTYGFEILDTSLYDTRPDVISICRNKDLERKEKLLLFRDKKHEQNFIGTNIYKTDNYKIINSLEGTIHLDDIILPLQSRKRNQVNYELLDQELAEIKSDSVISRHKR